MTQWNDPPQQPASPWQPSEVPAEYGTHPAPPAPEAKKSRLPYLIAAAVCVVALVAAGLVFANSRGWFTTSGATSPTEAVEGLFDALADDDLIGVIDRIAPAEAALTSGVTQQVLDELKRLEIVKTDVTADQLYSLDVTVTGLTVAPEAVVINDHVQVVELTAGTITVDTTTTASVLTPKMQDAVAEAPLADDGVETVDLAEEAKKSGRPLRIATVAVDGRWYPSLFYTMADNMAVDTLGENYPGSLTALQAAGAATPKLEMDALLDSLLSGDMRKIAATVDPGTLGALHDYASAIFGDGSACIAGAADGGSCAPTGLHVVDAQWSTTAVAAGQKVLVDSLVLRTEEGDITVQRDPAVPSLTVTVPGEDPWVMSPDAAVDFVADVTSMFGVDAGDIAPEMRDIIKREVAELLNWGVTMVQGPDGRWYVSPVHSATDLVLALMRGLQPGDIDYFLAGAR